MAKTFNTIEEQEKELLNNVFEFDDITVSEIMRHRKDIFAVDINTNIEETYLIAGHSGIGKKAYFNDLNKLKKDDDVYLKFKDKTIHYKVIAITSVIKTGEIEISNEGNLLYLTTCDQIIDGYQLIITAKKV